MRRLIGMAVATAVLVGNGCLFNSYSSNPVRRMNQLMSQSDDLRVLEDERDRIMFMDQPSHMVVDRVHGGITPGIATNRPN